MRLVTAPALLLLLSGCAGAAGSAGTCTPVELSEIPLLRVGLEEIVPVTIDNDPAGLLLDTGANGTSVTPQAIAALGLRDSPVFIGEAGVGGEQNNSAVEIGSIGIGAQTVHDAVAMDIPLTKAPLDRFPVYGLLGEDITSHYDLDFDAAHDTLTLYSPHHCANPSPTWGSGAQRVDLEIRNNDLQNVMPVTLNGHDIRAELDTGASRSLVNEQAVGLDPNTVAADPRRQSTGLNMMTVDERIHHFPDLIIAGRSYGPADLPVTTNTLPGGIDMLLGEDFLHRHRIYLSFQAHNLLIAPASP
jgi:predicted aspartyl protease